MAFHIPGTNLNIGKDKGAAKKRALKDAYAKVLNASSAGSAKTEWPEMAPGENEWYGPEGHGLRMSTLAGYQREAEHALGGALPRNKIILNGPYSHPKTSTNPNDLRAYSQEGAISFPDPRDEGGYYFSKPQYLQATMAHEVAHNADRYYNKPKIGHGPTFRPLEKAAMSSAGLAPEYDPGTDYTGNNEYADRIKSLTDYAQHYYLGANPQDLTRSVSKVDPRKLAVALILQQKKFNQTAPVKKATEASPSVF